MQNTFEFLFRRNFDRVILLVKHAGFSLVRLDYRFKAVNLRVEHFDLFLEAAIFFHQEHVVVSGVIQALRFIAQLISNVTERAELYPLADESVIAIGRA